MWKWIREMLGRSKHPGQLSKTNERQFLRKFGKLSWKNGILTENSIFCVEDGLSSYLAGPPRLDGPEQWGEFRDYVEEQDNKACGVYTLTEADMEEFGLLPKHEPDDGYPKYRDDHWSSLCLEHVLLGKDPTGAKDPKSKYGNTLCDPTNETDGNRRLVKARKLKLAAIAQSRIVLHITESPLWKSE